MFLCIMYIYVHTHTHTCVHCAIRNSLTPGIDVYVLIMHCHYLYKVLPYYFRLL